MGDTKTQQTLAAVGLDYVSLTSQAPRMSSTTDSSEESGPGLSPWKDLNLSQILLPVLCGGFIAVVIFVIACCLTKRKAKPFRRRRERSCHTIETSHDTSEYGIYDVIDQVKGKSKSSEKSRRQDKLTSNCILASQNELGRSKTGDIFTTPLSALPLSAKLDSLLTPSLPECTKHDWKKFDRKFEASDLSLPHNGTKLPNSSHEEEEGIYETLDRYWTLTSSLKKDLSVQLATTNDLPGSDETLKVGSPMIKEECSGNPPSYNPKVDSGSHHFQNVPANFSQTAAERVCDDKILCQLTLFHISNTDESSRQAETVYYYVNLQSLSIDRTDSLPSVLQNARLQVLPDQENKENKSSSRSITLEPVESAMVPMLNESVYSTQSASESTHKRKVSIPKSSSPGYEQPPRTCSKRTPILLAKKSESFRDANTELQAAKDNFLHCRRRSDSSNSEVQAPTPVVSPTKVGPEAEKIIRKLGPLPPVPGPLPPVPGFRPPLCRAESENGGRLRHAARIAGMDVNPSQNFNKKHSSRPLPLSPDGNNFSRHRIERSASEVAFNRCEVEEVGLPGTGEALTPEASGRVDGEANGEDFCGSKVAMKQSSKLVSDNDLQQSTSDVDSLVMRDVGSDSHYFVLEPHCTSDSSDNSSEGEDGDDACTL
ncbi:unnamed protein product [Lymnaea stagnalis]|uniref:Uncharacterized protein n=1 Tax=Lymnaea stagnalis TaxID=6523 RepID=A0AAV2HKL3_LYMST